MNPIYIKSSALLKEYLNQSKKLTAFFRQPLYPDWAQLADKVSENFTQSAVIDELISQNSGVSDTPSTKNMALLKQKNTVCIVTGQQLGLMISPLYIVYKTISTLLLCDRLNKEIDSFNFVPVFWLEGEDHDFEEVRSLNVFDKSANLLNLSLPDEPENKNYSVNKRQFNEGITSLLNQLKENLQPTEFSDDLFNRLGSTYLPNKNWLAAFKEHMSSLFAGTGLLFFNAGSPKIKELSKPFFAQVLTKNCELIDSFKSQSSEMEKAGYKNQVTIQENKAYLFLSKSGSRQSLFLTNNGFVLKDSKEEFSHEEIQHLLQTNPEYFSSTVLTRPLWQSWLLPTVSYVAGGAEIAYWGQLSKGFDTLNLVMPQVQPRHSLTLVEPKIERLSSKYDNNLALVNSVKSEFLKEYFKNNQLGEINTILTELETVVAKNKESVKELVQDVDPTLLGPVEKSYSSISGTIYNLQNKLSNRVKEKEVTIQNHLNAIHEALLPGGVLQERVLSSVYFENKYGPQWVLKIKERVTDNFSEHFIVKI